MKNRQITNMILCCFLLLTMNVAQGQIHLSNGRLILYKLDKMQGKYVLCMNDASHGNYSSFTVIGDTFSIQPAGAMCWVVMTNACILETSFSNSSSNEVVQNKMLIDVYKLPLSEHTKLVFNNSVVELAKANIEHPEEANAKVYEGEDALKKIKEMGGDLPDDIDTNQAAGH